MKVPWAFFLKASHCFRYVEGTLEKRKMHVASFATCASAVLIDRDMTDTGNCAIKTSGTQGTIIENGWKKCGILEALENGVPSDDPFE